MLKVLRLKKRFYVSDNPYDFITRVTFPHSSGIEKLHVLFEKCLRERLTETLLIEMLHAFKEFFKLLKNERFPSHFSRFPCFISHYWHSPSFFCMNSTISFNGMFHEFGRFFSRFKRLLSPRSCFLLLTYF